MRVVLDTNIAISALLWRGNPRRVLDAARDGIIDLFTSPALIAELEDVLSRDKFAARMAAANVTVEKLLEGYAALATVIDPEPLGPVIIRDPDDDAVLACAITAECEIIASGDDDLISLGTFREIRIMTASELLAELAL